MQKQVPERQSEKITIDTPYGVIEADSGNHFVDVATIIVIISFCVFTRMRGRLAAKEKCPGVTLVSA